MHKAAAAILFALVACCSFVPRAFCETETAIISGRLTDPSGTAIAGAEIRLENLDQVTVLRTDSNKDGIYAFSSVPPGRYHMSTRKAGFRPRGRQLVTLGKDGKLANGRGSGAMGKKDDADP